MAELHGAALDRAVAEIITGWTDRPGRWGVIEGVPPSPPPRYSSDWSRLPEMLRHLVRDDPSRWVSIDVASDGTDAVLWHRGDGPIQGGVGAHELEAVARLIVAVAEAKDA